MLEVTKRDYAARQPANLDGIGALDLGAVFRSVLGGARRQWPIIVAAVVAMCVIAVLYIVTATPMFTATSSVIIDPRVNNAGPNAPSAPMLLLSDALVVDSEVEVLRSRELVNRVIDTMKLMDVAPAEEDQGAVTAALAKLRKFLDSWLVEKPAVEEAVDAERASQRRREEIARSLSNGLDVARSGDTYVINVSYTSPDAYQAARLANAFTDQYFVLQAEAVYENTRRVNEWLSDRVNVLAQRVVEADRAVETYKSENALVSVKGDQLPSEVELTAANDQLIQVRGEILSLGASITQLQTIIDTGALNASIDPAVRTTSLTELQSRYSELVAREQDLTSRFGASHQLAQRAREEIAATGRLIVDEFRKIVGSRQSELAILKSREAEYASRVASLRTETAEDRQKMIRLRELEREATSNRTLYEAMLGKLNETTQQETFRSAPARVIAKAVPPDKKSAPKSKIIFALALFGGLVVGAGGAFLREQLDNVFRMASSVDDDLGVPLLGLIPIFSLDRRLTRSGKDSPGPLKITAERFGDFRALVKRALPNRFAVDYPASMFAETLRSISFAVNSGRTGKEAVVIGVTSINKGEGKSTLSSNLASYMSSHGNRVVLIDFDVRNPTLTQLMRGQHRNQYLGRILGNPAATAGLLPNPVFEGTFFIGNDGNTTAYNPSDLSFMRALDALVAKLRHECDYVVIDLPPLANLVDARVASNVVDHVVMAIEWGKTHRTTARNVVLGSPQLRSRLTGTVYTKVRLNAYGKYNSDASTDYYSYSR